MAISRYTPEQISTLLRQIEVSIGNGKTTPKPARVGDSMIDQLKTKIG